MSQEEVVWWCCVVNALTCDSRSSRIYLWKRCLAWVIYCLFQKLTYCTVAKLRGKPHYYEKIFSCLTSVREFLWNSKCKDEECMVNIHTAFRNFYIQVTCFENDRTCEICVYKWVYLKPKPERFQQLELDTPGSILDMCCTYIPKYQTQNCLSLFNPPPELTLLKLKLKRTCIKTRAISVKWKEKRIT